MSKQSSWKRNQKLSYIPSNLCNQYAENETAIMATPPRNIFRQDAERHVSVSVYRPLSTNSHAVMIPESTVYHKTNPYDHS
jgi:hypothetical protein